MAPAAGRPRRPDACRAAPALAARCPALPGPARPCPAARTWASGTSCAHAVPQVWAQLAGPGTRTCAVQPRCPLSTRRGCRPRDEAGQRAGAGAVARAGRGQDGGWRRSQRSASGGAGGSPRAVRDAVASAGGRRAVGDEFDVVVVGAGPAGAAAALTARRAGASVLLLDRADFPRDKACGDGIAAHSVDVLAELGVTEAVAGYAPVPALRMIAPGRRCGGPGAAPARVHGAPARCSTRGWWRPRWPPARSCAGTPCAGSSRAPTGWCSTGSVRPGGDRRGRRRLGGAPGARPAARTPTGTWRWPSGGTPRLCPARPSSSSSPRRRAGRRTPGRSRSATGGRTSGTGRCCAVSR